MVTSMKRLTFVAMLFGVLALAAMAQPAWAGDDDVSRRDASGNSAAAK
jgi:hypothetical protein